MALQFNYNSRRRGSSDVESILAQFQELANSQNIKPKKDKAGLLTRLLAPLTAVGSTIDAFNDASTNDSNVLFEYGKNLANSLGVSLLGNEQEDFYDTGDFLLENDILQGDDIFSKTANFGVGLGGDIISDPTTLLGGAGVISKVGKLGKVGKVAAEGLDLLSNPLIKVPQLGGKGLVKGLDLITDKKGTKLADTFTDLFSTTKRLRGKVGDDIVDNAEHMRAVLGNIDVTTKAEQADFLNRFNALPEEIRAQLNDYVDTGIAPSDPTVKNLFDEFLGNVEGQSKKMQHEGILQEKDLIKGKRYLPRETLGFKKQFINDMIERIVGQTDNPQGQEMIRQTLEQNLLGNKKIANLADDDYIDVDQFSEILNKGFKGGSSDKLLDPRKQIDDYLEHRTFETLKAGEEAGVVYSKDLGNIYQNFMTSSNKALAQVEYIKSLKNYIDPATKKQLFLDGNEFKTLFKNVDPEKIGYKKIDTGLRQQEIVDTLSNIKDTGVAQKELQRRVVHTNRKLRRLDSEIKKLNQKGLHLTLKGMEQRVFNEVDLIAEAKHTAKVVNSADEQWYQSKSISNVLRDWESNVRQKGLKSQLLTAARKAYFNNDKSTEALSDTIQDLVAKNPQYARSIQTVYKTNVRDGVKRLVNDFVDKAQDVDPLKWKKQIQIKGKGMTTGKVKSAVKNLLAPEQQIAGLKSIRNKLNLRDPRSKELHGLLDSTIKDLEDLTNYKKGAKEKVGELMGQNVLYAPAEVAELMNNYNKTFFGDDATGEVMKYFDKFNSFFKSSVTGRSPLFIGYQARNAIGDFINMLAGGYRFRHLDYGAVQGNTFKVGKDLIAFEDKVLSEGKEAAIKAYSEDMYKLWQDVINTGVALKTQSQEDIGQITEKTLRKGRVQSKMDTFLKGVDRATMRSTFEKRERLFRFANVLDQYASTKDWNVAGRLAKLSSIDYTNLTEFEKNYMKRLIPFYSFMKQNAAFHLDNMSKNPRFYQTYQHVFENFNSAFGGDLTPEEMESLPDWMKKGLTITLGRKGNVVDILTQTGDPIDAINELLPSKLIGAVNPAGKIPLERVTDYDFFKGERISEGTDGRRFKDSPKWLQDLIGFKAIPRKTKDGKEYVDYLVDPNKVKNLYDIPMISQISTLFNRLGDLGIGRQIRGEGEMDLTYLAPLLTGSRIYDQDLDTAKYYKDKELEDKLYEALMKEGLAKEKKTRYVPEEAKILLEGGII